MSKYVITGLLYNSTKRFAPIYTTTPYNYNIWRGSVWKILDNGKRRLIKRIYN